jgi:hypothetical protein
MVKGYNDDDAKKHIIGNWETREKMDYEQWLRFYKEKVPEKYPKLAYDDSLFVGGLPVEVLRAKMHMSGGKFPNPIAGGEGNAQKRSPGIPELPSTGDNDSVRDRIEGQRRKLVSRLNAAEKMLASMDGQLFAGDDQELMLKLLQDLKRRIQITNKRTAKSTLFEDQIYRTANQLRVNGRIKAADFFYKLAQFGPMPPLPGAPGGDDAPPAPAGGDDNASKQDTHDLLQEFFDNITRGVSDKDDTPEKREEQEKKDKAPTPAPAPAPAPTPGPPATPGTPATPPGPPAPATASIQDRIKLGMGFWNIKSAQDAPPPPPPPPQEVAVEAPEPTPDQPEDNTDDVIEAALRNVSVNDVINRLEMMVSVYNKRELSRQLSILDLMMDRLGLASHFPELGEAMSKALDGNQYIGTRLESVLGKIKGSVDVPAANKWIEPTPDVNRPDTAGIRQRLEQQEADEEKRREMRKQKDLAQQPGQPGQAPGAMPRGPENAAAAAPLGQAVELQSPARVEKAPPINTR